MFDIDKSIGKILEIKSSRKPYSKPTCNFQKVPIKKPYVVKYKGMYVGYGKRVISQGKTTTTIQDVKDVFKKHPELVKQAKGTHGIMITSYNSPYAISKKGSFSRAKFMTASSKDKMVQKPVIVLQANPHLSQIREKGIQQALCDHKQQTAQELAHELEHYKQYKERRPFSERSALRQMKKY